MIVFKWRRRGYVIHYLYLELVIMIRSRGWMLSLWSSFGVLLVQKFRKGYADAAAMGVLRTGADAASFSNPLYEASNNNVGGAGSSDYLDVR